MRGLWHQERGLMYVQLDESGHDVINDEPALALKAHKVFLGHLPHSALSES